MPNFNEAQHATAHDFSELVDSRVEEQYGLQDGGDLCYNLIEQGVIDMSKGADEAARIVAMHMVQA